MMDKKSIKSKDKKMPAMNFDYSNTFKMFKPWGLITFEA